MSYLLKLAQNFEDKTNYINNISNLVSSLQKNFPQIKLKSFQEFELFLKRYVPTIIRKYLVGTRSVKNCSGVSPDFAEFAAQFGFAVVSEKIPGHMRNIFLSEDGPYLIDLSYIQFTCGYKGYGDDDVLIKTLQEIFHNPFKAVKIEKLSLNYFGNFREPLGKYDNLYDPKKDIEQYDQDKEWQEEDIKILDNWKKQLDKKKENGKINSPDTNLERKR